MPDTNSVLETIESLATEATQDAADKLRDIEANAVEKDVRKATRRALYRLSERGVRPSVRDTAPVVHAYPARTPGASRTFASICDGAGNQMLLFEIPDPDGGRPTLLQLLINDVEGVKDIGTSRLSKRELDEMIQRVVEAIDTGLAVAEVEIDYARWLVSRARAVGRLQGKTSPPGVLEWMERVGGEDGDYAEPPIYKHVSAEEIQSDTTLSHDPDDLFALIWFQPWFFSVEDVRNWIQRWVEINLAGGQDTESEVAAKHEALIAEATNVLFDGMRENYVRRLESSADILFRRDRVAEGRLALWHALDLKADQPAANVLFARAIVLRTFSAAIMPMGSGDEETSDVVEDGEAVVPQ